MLSSLFEDPCHRGRGHNVKLCWRQALSSVGQSPGESAKCFDIEGFRARLGVDPLSSKKCFRVGDQLLQGGAQQLATAAGGDVVRVFVLPPSIGELESRLQRRAQDSAEVVAARMAKAVDEMSHYDEYDYVLVNYALDDSVARARAILNAERTCCERYTGLHDFVRTLTKDRT